MWRYDYTESVIDNTFSLAFREKDNILLVGGNAGLNVLTFEFNRHSENNSQISRNNLFINYKVWRAGFSNGLPLSEINFLDCN